MNSDLPQGLRRELLDDFYAECDEQLSAIRTCLTDLEAADLAHPPVAVTEALFRNLHSLKGNAAIVGLREAETLAHAAEDYLRALSRGTVALTTEAMEVLHTATQRLEHIVAAHRREQPIPDVEKLRSEISALVGSQKASSVGEPPAIALDTRPATPYAPATSGPQWRCTFAPTRELDERGVNINVVRARLLSFAKILSASPSVRPRGGMVFEFVIEADTLPIEHTAWAADGLSFVQVAPAYPASLASPPPTAASAVPTAPADHVTSFFIAPSHIVRVDLSRLDDLMRIAGDLVVQRSRLDDRLNQVESDKSALKEVNLAFGRTLVELRKAITRVRLVPIAEIFSRMPFVVRDLARESEKKVRLVVEGQQTEIDKYLVERLKEPLLHLVRNAFSHGIERPTSRADAGKPPEGTIWLSAKAVGESVVIQIRDDGSGIDAARVAAQAASAHLAVPEVLDEPALLALLCAPGFSTREEADRASGRGVGMAVVQNTVRELGGTLTLQNTPGQGAQFTLRLPVTLSILETFIVSVGSQTCAVPQAFVDEILDLSEDEVQTIKKVEVIRYREGVLPLVRLRSLFGGTASPRRQPVLVINTERGSTGLVVDRVHAQREVVVRRMNDPLLQVPGISGATELGDGRPVLILDPLALTKGAVRPNAAPAATQPTAQEALV